MPLHRPIAALLGAVLLAGSSPALAGAPAVKERHLRRHVEWLAHDARAGREAGSRGVETAEAYIARAFAEAGLRPLPGRSSFYLPFPLYRGGFDTNATRLALEMDGERLEPSPGAEFRPFPFSGEGTVEAEVVFAGYGITAPEHGWDDYEDLDVEGKIVLVLRHEPGEKDPQSSFDGTQSTEHAQFSKKAVRAREQGALAMLLVTDPLHHPPAEDFRMNQGLSLDPPKQPSGEESREESEEEAGEPEPIPSLHLARATAEVLARRAGWSLEEAQRALDAGEARASSFSLEGATARLHVRRTEGAQVVRARNVAGWIEGSDPELARELVVVGAHHDHVGAFHGEGDTVFNGADDNASGTAAVLELARVLAASPDRPRRSIVFLTFSAEEKGLLGSRALVRQELLDVDRVVFMLNLDMIGRNPERPVEVYGDGYVRGIRPRVEELATALDLEVDFAGDGYAGNSDHDPFYRRDIPFLFPFTGTHEDYHQIGDHPEKLAYGRMVDITRLARGVVESVANAEAPPVFIHHVPWLGIRVEVEDASRAVVTGVQEASRAEKAGMREGDVLLAFDEVALDPAAAVGRAFRAVEPGTEVALRVGRDGAEEVVTVERAPRGYVGIWPGRLDEDLRAEAGIRHGEGVLVRRVVPDGPAAEAGLLENDVILQIDGRPVGMRNLAAILAQIGAEETVDLMLWREGERMDLRLTLGKRPSRRS